MNGPATGQIVIIGGGLAAIRTVEQLRRAKYDGQICIVSNEAHLPYDRPPLSKQVLSAGRNDVALKPQKFYEDNGIALRLSVAAQSLDSDAKTVALSDGTSIGYDELVIATGLVPKNVPTFSGLAGVHVLRSLDDSLALRSHATTAKSAVVVGAGFIGCEVAASLRSLDLPVLMVEPQQQPLASVLGERIGALVKRLHIAHGVRVRTATGVSGAFGDERIEHVVLSDQTRVKTDLVVVGIGSRPSIDWLADSGVQLGDGILCDHVGRTSAPHVWSLGDVAAWRDSEGHVRVEHWSNVAEQARVLVPALLGHDTPPSQVAVRYFWSDQYGLKIQCLGVPHADDAVHIVNDDGYKFLAFYERDGSVIAAVGAGNPSAVLGVRSEIADRAPISTVLG
nr:FAD/NAD(P)-binding oxidoreductase [Mycolicibacterium mucogenicum]